MKKKTYQVIARKYRPQTFEEVVGQTPILLTLKNAIRLQRVSHAYLFCGSRGIGKTTLARIFAKALNCKNLSEKQEPCNECSSCKEITFGGSLDVIEIDGASNRGIDDIRQINESLLYNPSSSSYKIYIIDEVHMLTKEAFNALLKTLEEPPPQVKFFFATTEPHKIPTTILSRCQRFDLARISQKEIVQKLSKISESLQREVFPEVLNWIARLSEGSLRDAESLLDQILCYEEGKISVEKIQNTFGWIPHDYFFSLDLACKNQTLSFAFECGEMLFSQGKNLSYFLEELLEHYRTILLFKIHPSSPKSLSESLHKKYQEHSSFYTEDQCLFILELLIKTLSLLPKTPMKQVTLEMIFLQIIKSAHRISTTSLMQKLFALEKKIESSKIPPPSLEEKPTQETSPPNPEQKIELEKIPFSLPQKELPPVTNKPVQEEEKKVEPPPEKTSPQRKNYETLLRFASVELEGVLQTPKTSES